MAARPASIACERAPIFSLTGPAVFASISFEFIEGWIASARHAALAAKGAPRNDK